MDDLDNGQINPDPRPFQLLIKTHIVVVQLHLDVGIIARCACFAHQQAKVGGGNCAVEFDKAHLVPIGDVGHTSGRGVRIPVGRFPLVAQAQAR